MASAILILAAEVIFRDNLKRLYRLSELTHISPTMLVPESPRKVFYLTSVLSLVTCILVTAFAAVQFENYLTHMDQPKLWAALEPLLVDFLGMPKQLFHSESRSAAAAAMLFGWLVTGILSICLSLSTIWSVVQKRQVTALEDYFLLGQHAAPAQMISVSQGERWYFSALGYVPSTMLRLDTHERVTVPLTPFLFERNSYSGVLIDTFEKPRWATFLFVFTLTLGFILPPVLLALPLSSFRYLFIPMDLAQKRVDQGSRRLRIIHSHKQSFHS